MKDIVISPGKEQLSDRSSIPKQKDNFQLSWYALKLSSSADQTVLGSILSPIRVRVKIQFMHGVYFRLILDLCHHLRKGYLFLQCSFKEKR